MIMTSEKGPKKVMYWENEYSTTFEELTKSRKSRGQWKRKTEAKEIHYQEVLKVKVALQNSIQVLEHQLFQ